jgi:two-component system cell cycle sensor histidine kinase PleC
MRPAQQRPNPGLFDHKRVARHEAEFAIDTAAGTLLRANPAGWEFWGLDPAIHALPLALDFAMPAMQHLREVARRNGSASSHPATLTFWTRRGVTRLVCRVEPEGQAEPIVTVRALEHASAVLAQRSRIDDDIPGRCQAHPEIATEAFLAHELRTPLSAVIAYAEILKDEHFGPLANARYKGYARDIHDSARHALSVVDSIMRGDPCRSLVPPLAFAELDPLRVVESCLTVSRPLAERAGLLLEVQCTAPLPRIVADELTLKQMLLNLLTNATKFARPGDRVTIGIENEDTGGLRISVTDTGPGMTPAAMDAPCGKTRPVGAGLGLGLPLTRALASANGATFTIDSEPGRGTRASISFGHDRIVAAS